MNYDKLQEVLADAFEKALNSMDEEETAQLSWFCTQEEEN